MSEVAVVILNWRTPELTLECANRVFLSKGMVPDVIVVDNASDDGSVGMLRAGLADRATVVEAERNLGYAGGMNLGIREAVSRGARYALLLNSDTFLAGDTIVEFVRAAEVRPCGVIFGPSIFSRSFDETRAFIGGRWVWKTGTIGMRFVDAAERPDEPQELEFVNGAAMFIDLHKLGEERFDERYGLYFEESDLCSRVVRNGGKLYYAPRAKVLHAAGASVRRVKSRFDLGQYYRTRNRLLWGRSNLSGLKSIVFWLNALLRFPLKLVLTLPRGRIGEFKAILLGMLDYARGRFGMPT